MKYLKYLFLFSVFLLPTPINAQQTPVNCPTISISGPSGTSTTNRIPYVLSVGKEIELYQPTFKWSASAGEIVLGTEGRGIEVIVPDGFSSNLTVSLEISGLPPSCPNTDSETMGCRLQIPKAEKLDEITGSLARISPKRYDAVLTALRQNPAAMLYITVSSGKTASTSIKQKRFDLLKSIDRDLYEMRIVFVESEKDDDKVVFWLLPAGANEPIS